MYHKMLKKRIYGGIAAIMFGVFCITQMTVPVSAKEKKADKATGNLTVTYMSETSAVSGAPMSLYYVGAKDKEAFSWDKDFAKYRLYGKEIEKLSGVLQGYVQRDKIKPDMEAVTDENGVATFSNLEQGYYLVIGGDVERDGVTLHMLPVLASVLGDGAATKAESKYERADVGEGMQTITAKKKWVTKQEHVEGEAVVKEAKPTKSVQADLMQDGKLIDTVTLSEENGWSHTWEFPSGHVYQVLETVVPEDFEMSMESEDGTMTIVNHSAVKTAVSKNPAKKEVKKETKHVESAEVQNEAPAVTETVSEKLPQTGMQYGPIVLCVLGCVVFGTIGGVCVYKKKHIK